MKNKPTIIGTGLSGMVGQRFTELFDRQFKFVNLDITTGIDITDKEKVKQKIGESDGEVVIHFAAFTDVNQAQLQTGNKDGSCYRINVLGTRNVAQSCKAANRYLIHLSTDFVFDGKKDDLYYEDDSPNPIEWYGQTKLWAEQEVRQQAGKHVIIRIAYPYRAHFPGKQDLVRKLISKLKNGQHIPAFTDHIITPTFIDDIAQALKKFIVQKPTGIFHVTGSTPVSDYGLATMVAQVFKLNQALIKENSLEEFLKHSKRPYQKHLGLSNQKLKNELGISMSTLQQGLAKIKTQMKR